MKNLGMKWLLLSTVAGFVGCSDESSNQLMDSGFDPKPERTSNTDLVQMAKRYRGQSDFSNVEYSTVNRALASAASAERADAGSEQREIQESDVFKIGSKDSKLLYLLNSNRGLQVVSFRDGVKAPKILGRVAPTGNYSESMYYLEDQGRIVVLENNYQDDNGAYSYTSKQSRIVVYDVENEESPKIDSVIDLDGQVADSRVVGDVLYIATSVRPNYYNRNNEEKPKGLVYSIKFGDAGVVKDSLNRVELSLPASARENMNIVEVKEGESYRYYLLAVLSESGWGWWDARSLVEVVDITDTEGKIRPLMVVSAKGNINERSQTFIRDDKLVVVSNYRVEGSTGANNRAIARIAVETFALPTATSTIVSEDEAEYRKLHIERQLKGLSDDERDNKRAELLADKELGLKGLFVKTEDGKIRKIVADHAVTVGDTTGLSASLQDVRVKDNLLYVFWVPANNIDPLDLFDISDLDNGVKYLKRLQFDGWISRAEPIAYKGKQFVVGLGWVVPNVNNERWRRQPQIMLFEIITHNNSPRALDVAQYSLPMENGYANFNRGDKYVDFRMDAQGNGSVMFQITGKIADKWRNGGKIIGVDLNAAIDGQSDQVFTEGGFLATDDAGWLKRIFRNDEIEKINTFSDMQLATFEDKVRTTDATAVMDAISVLELARNTRAFIELSEVPYGVQIVSKGSMYSYYGNASPATTELRLVSADKVDAELTDVESVLELDGNFASKMILGQNEFLISTQNQVKADQGVEDATTGIIRFQYKTENTIYRIKFDAQKLVVVSKMILEDNPNMTARTTEFNYRMPYGNGGVDFINEGEGLAFFQNQLFVIEKGSKSILKQLSFEGCAIDKELQLQVKILSGKLFFHGSKRQDYQPDPNYQPTVVFNRHYLSALNIDWENNTVSCGSFMNVPGEPISYQGNKLITKDNRLVELTKKENSYTRANGEVVRSVYYDVQAETILTAVTTELGQTAKLSDLYDAHEIDLSSIRVLKNGALVYLKGEASSQDFDIYPMYERFGGGYYPGGYTRNYQKPAIAFLSLDDEGFFTSQRSSFEIGIDGKARIDQIIDGGTDRGEFLLTTVGRRLLVVKIDSDLSIAKKSLEVTTINGKVSEEGDSVLLPGWVSSWGSLTGDYNAEKNSLVVSQGNTGFTHIKILD